MVRWPQMTRNAAPSGNATAATMVSSPAANFFASMPSILLPRPRASSGSSATGKHSSLPPSLTAATSVPSPAGTGQGRSTRAAPLALSTCLPLRLRDTSSSSRTMKP